MKGTFFRWGLHRQNRKDKLVADLSGLVAKAGQVLKEAGAEVQGTFDSTKTTLADAGTAVSGSARHAADATDKYVKANPWKMLGVAAAVGAVVGMLLTTARR